MLKLLKAKVRKFLSLASKRRHSTEHIHLSLRIKLFNSDKNVNRIRMWTDIVQFEAFKLTLLDKGNTSISIYNYKKKVQNRFR